MVQTKLFTSNQSQAVRLPRAVAFPEGVTVVDVLKVGRSRVIVPAGQSWAAWFENGPFLSDDFPERDQGVQQEREEL